MRHDPSVNPHAAASPVIPPQSTSTDRELNRISGLLRCQGTSSRADLTGWKILHITLAVLKPLGTDEGLAFGVQKLVSGPNGAITDTGHGRNLFGCLALLGQVRIHVDASRGDRERRTTGQGTDIRHILGQLLRNRLTKSPETEMTAVSDAELLCFSRGGGSVGVIGVDDSFITRVSLKSSTIIVIRMMDGLPPLLIRASIFSWF